MSEFKKGVQSTEYSFVMMDINSPRLRKTGLTPAVELSKDGGGFVSSVGSATEIDSKGWYTLSVITSTELNTEVLLIVASAENAGEWNDRIYTVERTQGEIYSLVDSLSVQAVNITNSAVNLIWTHPFSNYESSATERSPHWGNAKLVNAVNFSGANLQIKKINDTDNLFVQVSSGDVTATPIISLDTT